MFLFPHAINYSSQDFLSHTPTLFCKNLKSQRAEKISARADDKLGLFLNGLLIKAGAPGTPLTCFNDRGRSDRGSYFISKKSQLQTLSTQKNPYFLALPKQFLGVFVSANVTTNIPHQQQMRLCYC